MTQQKEVVSSKETPTLPGLPYSPAIKIGQFLFTAGQLADDTQADMKTQTRQALNKIKALLEVSGSSLENVVKCSVFITDFNEFTLMNEAYGEYFKDEPPARTTVQVSRLAKNAKIEIEAIATIP